MEATPNGMTWDLADAYNSIEARSVSKPGTNMDFFPDDAEDHWAFQTVRKLKKGGLMVGYSQGLVYHLPPDGIIESRFEFAVKCHACSTNLRSLADELESEAKSIATDNYRQIDLKTNQAIARANELKKKISAWEPELMKLTNEFKRQIAMIGIDPDGMLSNIRSASSTIRRSRLNQPDLGQCQFSDVPANHWAAKQVLELRQLGILTGYPNTDSTPNTFNH